MATLTAILGALSAIATLATLANKYVPMLVASLNNVAESIHDHNAIEKLKLAGKKAEDTGDTSDLENPLHGGKI